MKFVLDNILNLMPGFLRIWIFKNAMYCVKLKIGQEIQCRYNNTALSKDMKELTPRTSKPICPKTEAKSRNYQGVFEVKSRVKTLQVRGIWSQQLEQKKVPQWGMEPDVRKGKRSLLACHTHCKCSMETTRNRWRPSSASRSWNWKNVWLVGKPLLVKDQNVI